MVTFVLTMIELGGYDGDQMAKAKTMYYPALYRKKFSDSCLI